MTRYRFRRFAVCSCAAAALLAGCGVSQAPIGALRAMPQSAEIVTHAWRGGSWIAPEAKTGPPYHSSGPLVYVSNATGVTIYHANGKDPGAIVTILDSDYTGPDGECIDSHGTLYVTYVPAADGGWVSEYPLGKTEPTATIRNPNDTPLFCAIDAHDNLWVTWAGTPNNVTEYLYGTTTPYFVITYSLTFPDGIAVDRRGDVYVGNLAPPNHSNILMFPPGSKTPSRIITDGITWPVGIALDSSGDLYVANTEQNNVEEYLAGHDHPYRTINQGLHLPSGLTLNAQGWLYVANDAGTGQGDDVVEFPPGSTTPSKRQIKKDVHTPIDVAHYPAVLP